MLVHCEICNAEFSLADEQVGPEGLSLRCSVCDHVFFVEQGNAEGALWQVRTIEDLLFTAPDLGTLEQWAREGRLHPDDQISRTGRHWTRVGDMPELAPVFGGAPALIEPVAPTERAAADVGPPPAFGSEASGARQETASMLDAVSRYAAPGSGPVPIASPPAAPTPVPVEEPDVHAPTQPAIEPRPEVLEVPMPPGPVRPAVPAPKPPPPPEPPAPQSARPFEPRRPSALIREMGLSDSQQVDLSEGPDASSPSASWQAGSLPGDSMDLDIARGRGRGRSGLLWGALGAVAAVGIVLGVPGVRRAVLGGADRLAAMVRGPSSDPSATIPELAKVDEALRTLDPSVVGRTEAALQARLDEGGLTPAQTAAIGVAQARLLAMRALVAQVGATLYGDEGLAAEGRTLAAQAREVLGRVAVEHVPDREALRRTRALVRLSAGRSADEVVPLLPGGEAEPVAVWAKAAPLWRDPKAPVPPGVVATLSEHGSDLFSRLLLALALARGGDEAGARTTLEKARALSPSHPLLVPDRVGAPAPAEPSAAPAPEGGPEQGGAADAPPAKKKDAAAPPQATGEGPAKRDGPKGGGGLSTDRLIDRGCNEVEGGSAQKGVKLLLKAFDRRPGDLDVLVCLAKGNVRLGRNQVAEGYYDRALKRSPRHRTALAGAARLAAKMGRTQRALRLYERLRKVDPTDAEAKRYLAEHAPAPAATEAPASPEAGEGKAPVSPADSG